MNTSFTWQLIFHNAVVACLIFIFSFETFLIIYGAYFFTLNIIGSVVATVLFKSNSRGTYL